MRVCAARRKSTRIDILGLSQAVKMLQAKLSGRCDAVTLFFIAARFCGERIDGHGGSKISKETVVRSSIFLDDPKSLLRR